MSECLIENQFFFIFFRRIHFFSTTWDSMGVLVLRSILHVLWAPLISMINYQEDSHCFFSAPFLHWNGKESGEMRSSVDNPWLIKVERPLNSTQIYFCAWMRTFSDWIPSSSTICFVKWAAHCDSFHLTYSMPKGQIPSFM